MIRSTRWVSGDARVGDLLDGHERSRAAVVIWEVIMRALGVSVLLLAGLAPHLSAQASSVVRVDAASPDGEPVAGARVLFVADGKGVRPTSEATTNAEGSASLTLGADGMTGWLVVDADGWAPEVRRLAAAPSRSVDATLSAGNQLGLHVTRREDGSAVPEYWVVTVPRTEASESDAALARALVRVTRVRSDDGVTELTGLPDEPVDLAVFARRSRPSMHQAVRVVGRDEHLHMMVDDEGCSRHVLVEEDSGEPVEGARVVPVTLDGGREVGERVLRALTVDESDAEGHLTLCPFAGEAELEVQHSEYAHIRVRVDPTRQSEIPEVLKMPRGASLAVIVETRSRRPVSEVRVVVRSGDSRRESRADARGRAAFTHLDPTVDVRVEVYASGAHRPAEVRPLRLRAGEILEERFVLEPPRMLRIVLDDVPLAAAEVVVYEAGAASIEDGLLAEARTDELGVVELPLSDEPSEGAIVAVTSERFVLFESWPRLRPGDPVDSLREIRLDALRVEGRVVAEDDDSSVEGASLVCMRSGETGAVSRTSLPGDGAFSLEGLDRRIVLHGPGVVAGTNARGAFAMPLPRPCELVMVDGPKEGEGGGTWASLAVERSELEKDDVELRLARATELTVQVLAIEGRLPDGTSVSVWRWPETDRPHLVQGAPDGRAELTLAGRGPWVVVAQAEGFAPAIDGPIISESDSGVEIPLALRRGGFLDVDAVAAQGLEVRDHRGLSWLPWAQRSTNADGSVALGPLPPGRYELTSLGRRETVEIQASGERVTVRF